MYFTFLRWVLSYLMEKCVSEACKCIAMETSVVWVTAHSRGFSWYNCFKNKVVWDLDILILCRIT